MKNLRGNTNRVYQYLKTHKGITSVQAFELFGATRLSAIIYNLRKYGCIIDSSSKEGKNRYDEPVRFVEYQLKSE